MLNSWRTSVLSPELLARLDALTQVGVVSKEVVVLCEWIPRETL